MKTSEIFRPNGRPFSDGAHSPSRHKALAPLAGLAVVAAVMVTLGASGLPAPLERPSLEQAAIPAFAVTPKEAKPRALASYARLPLSFVPNAGQTDARVRFYAHGGGYGFYFTPRTAVLAFTKLVDRTEKGVALHLRFPGANSAPRIEGVQTGSGTVNYFVGRDPAKWRTALPIYHAVAYRDLWPGIDMVFRDGGGKLKYEFRLAPGADPSKIRLTYAGAESLMVSAAGSLLVDTPLGVLTDARPRTYQRIGGRRVPLESRYVLNTAAGSQSYGFALGAYDARYPLVIDPGLAYSTFLGGSVRDVGRSVVVDKKGNAYVTGDARSADFPTMPGAYDPSFNAGVSDGFVTKLNPSGTALVYSTYLGSTGFDLPGDIAVDKKGNAYVAGSTDGSDFPTTPGAFQETDPGPGVGEEGNDAFVTKLDPSGSALVYSTYAGAPGEETGNGIAVDEKGNAYVASSGATSSFPTTPGAPQPTDPGPAGDVLFGQDGILFKLNDSGSALVYATYLGGEARDIVNSMTIDDEGNLYAAGGTDSRNFPTTAGAFQEDDPQPVPTDPTVDPNPTDAGTAAAGPDCFVTKLNRSGTTFVYSTYLGGTGFPGGAGEGCEGIGVDHEGHAYVGGRTDSAADFPTTPDAWDTTYNGGENDAFVTKLNRKGSALVYSTFLGGSGGFEEGARFQVVIDKHGRAAVTAETDSLDFPTTPDAFQSANGGGLDAYVTMLNASGSALVYSTYLGGSGNEISNGIAMDKHADLYVTGRTGSANFPTTEGAFDLTLGGDRDAFVTKFDLNDDGD